MAIQNIPTHLLGCHAKVGIDVDIQGTTLVLAKSWQNLQMQGAYLQMQMIGSRSELQTSIAPDP